MTLPNPPYIGDPIPNGPFASPPVPATFDRLFGTLVPNIQLDPNPSDIIPVDNSDGWIRPEDWLPMPTVLDTQQRVVGIFAIYNLPLNLIAVQFEGDYTVDWGDGTTENFDSGDKAQHNYNWDDIPASTTTTEGYRQVLVSVTPQSGQDLTIADLSVRHDYIQESYSGSPWLDLLMSLPAADDGQSIILSGPISSSCLAIVQRVQIINAGGASDFGSLMGYSESVQEFVLGPNVVSSYSAWLGYYNGALKTIKFQNVTSLDNVSGMISQGYYPSVSVHLSNVTGVTDASSLFEGNGLVKKVIIENAPDLVNLERGFFNCGGLETVLISGVPNLGILPEAFYGCYALKTVVIRNCGSVADCSYTFSNCVNLQDVKIDETPLLFDTSGMFYGCYSLFNAPVISMQSVEEAVSMFDFCYSLVYCPDYDFASMLNSASMFKGCSALQKAPDVDMSNVEISAGMFADCYSLTQIPEYDFSSNIDLSNTFGTNTSLQLAPVKNVSVDISFTDCLLGRQAIIDVFNGLANASATIDVRYNYGTAELTPEDIAIATDKGWTVLT